jgi:hypothetical protein
MTLVFARKPSSDLASLVKVIDKQVAQSKDEAGAFVVFLPDDARAAQKEIEEFAAKEKISLPLTIPVSLDDVKASFNIIPRDNMPVHVLVYRDKSVKKPFTLKQITPKDVQDVEAAITANAA